MRLCTADLYRYRAHLHLLLRIASRKREDCGDIRNTAKPAQYLYCRKYILWMTGILQSLNAMYLRAIKQKPPRALLILKRSSLTSFRILKITRVTALSNSTASLSITLVYLFNDEHPIDF